MNFDWAVSLFVVTFIVFGLIVVEEVEFTAFERTYASETVTGSVAETIANKVDRVEGVGANTTEVFDYNQHQAGAVELPSNLIGHPYLMDFTHDYVITLTTTGSSVGTAVNFWQPVYVFNLSLTHRLANAPVNGTDLNIWASSTNGTCQSFLSGQDFIVTHEWALVDGHGEYLTIISSADGGDYSC